jgi:hypothetical protein
MTMFTTGVVVGSFATLVARFIFDMLFITY